MTSYNPANIKVGPGTLFAANLGTTEPVTVTGPWPSGWQPLGYTLGGTQFSITPATAAVQVEEEYWNIKTVLTGMDATLTFALAEQTARNLVISLNGGLTPTAAVQGTNTDGSVWVEPPDIGLEQHIMLGWDALPKAEAYTAGMDPFGRLICRQCLQSGAVQVSRLKGATYASYSATFSLEKPATGLLPFRTLFPAVLAS